MREYEVLVILDPAWTDERVEAEASSLRSLLEREGATVQEVQKWGKRRVAYELRKVKEGHYVLVRCTGPGRMVAEVDRQLKITEGVLRHMIVVAEEPRRKATRAETQSPGPGGDTAEGGASLSPVVSVGGEADERWPASIK